MRRRQIVVNAAAGLSGMAAGAFGSPGTSLDRLRPIFLSHVNDPAGTSVFPGDPEFTLETVATIPQDGFYMQYVREAEHTGTHWGSPNHFTEGALSADQLDARDLFLPAVKIDIRQKAAADPDYALTVEDLKAWEKRNGKIPPCSAVILWTGWSARWGTPAYPNFDAEGRMHQPGFSTAAAEWLIDNGKLGVRGALGTDTFGPDRGIDDTYPVSVLLYHHRRISLENLTNLGELPTTGAWILVGGPRNRDGSGSTATIYGLVLDR